MSELSTDNHLDKAERVSQPFQPPTNWSDSTLLMNTAQRVAADGTVMLPTLHLGDGSLNQMDSYRTDSNVAQLYIKNRPAIVRINTIDPRMDSGFSKSSGSGSIIDASGIIATGYHVVKNATAMRVQTSDGRVFDARLLEADPAKDEALIQIRSNNPWQTFPTVQLEADTNQINRNRAIVGLGFPKNQEAMHISMMSADQRMPISALKITDGLILGEDSNREVIRAHGPVLNGDSGGPAFDLATGKQMGIINLSDEVNGNAYITPIEDFQRFLARTKEKYQISSLPVQIPSDRVSSQLPMVNPSSIQSTINSFPGLNSGFNSAGTGLGDLNKLLGR